MTDTNLSNTGEFDNEGMLSLSFDQQGYYDAPSLINGGTVDFRGGATPGGTIAVDVIENTNHIFLSHDAQVLADGPVSNTGTITVDSTSTLEFSGNQTLSGLGTIVNDVGTVHLTTGTLDLGGGTIDITAGAPGASGFLLDGGTIQNGTIKTDGTGIHYTGAFNVLSNVTIDGTLDVNSGNSELDIENGFGFAGSPPGQIIETTGYLQFDGNHTLDNADLTLGNSTFYATGTLTLGSDNLVTLTGDEPFGPSAPAQYRFPDGILDNKGTIVAAGGGLDTFDDGLGDVDVTNEGLFATGSRVSGQLVQLQNSGTFSISGTAASVAIMTFDNTGAVDISDGGSLTVSNAEPKYGGGRAVRQHRHGAAFRRRHPDAPGRGGRAGHGLGPGQRRNARPDRPRAR